MHFLEEDPRITNVEEKFLGLGHFKIDDYLWAYIIKLEVTIVRKYCPIGNMRNKFRIIGEQECSKFECREDIPQLNRDQLRKMQLQGLPAGNWSAPSGSLHQISWSRNPATVRVQFPDGSPWSCIFRNWFPVESKKCISSRHSNLLHLTLTFTYCFTWVNNIVYCGSRIFFDIVFHSQQQWDIHFVTWHLSEWNYHLT